MSSSTRSKPPGRWYQRLCTFLWYDILVVLHSAVSAVWKDISKRPPVLEVNNLAKCTEQVAVLTGGPRGLALGIMKRLTQLDFTIIMGVRSVEDSQKRLDEFSKRHTELSFKNVRFLQMDLKSLKSVEQFAANVLQETSRIDLLICNAAIMAVPFELTVDGLESQFQVNYFSNFLLTELLMKKIVETAENKQSTCKIIYTSSMLHRYVKLDIDEFEKCKVYTSYKNYYRTKLYQVTNMLGLQTRLNAKKAQVYCYAVHPGLVPTDLWYQGGGRLVGWLVFKLKWLFRSVENGADTVLYPAFSSEFDGTGGLYMESGFSVVPCSTARNVDNQTLLYNKSVELVARKIESNNVDGKIPTEIHA